MRMPNSAEEVTSASGKALGHEHGQVFQVAVVLIFLHCIVGLGR